MNIDSSYGLTLISLVLQAGAATVTGNLSVNGVASTPINLVVGQPLTIAVDSPDIIDALTINAAAGTVAILARR